MKKLTLVLLFAHAGFAVTAQALPIDATLIPKQVSAVNQPIDFVLTLKYADGHPVLPQDIQISHTEEVHLFIIDPSLDDYHHEHPNTGLEPGTYTFSVTPKKSGEYKIFVETRLNGNNKTYYIPLTFTVPGKPDPVKKTVNENAVVNDFMFHSYFGDDPDNIETKIVANQDYIMTVIVSDAHGKPFHKLEPVMGAFAHMAAFSEDRKELVHVHPIGQSPANQDDRDGPETQFHLNFNNPGYYRIYAQYQIHGQPVYVPFGINVLAG